MRTRETYLPRKYHQAVERWRETFIPDYDFLHESWDKHFPKDQRFKLCAFRELGIGFDGASTTLSMSPRARQLRTAVASPASARPAGSRAKAGTSPPKRPNPGSSRRLPRSLLASRHRSPGWHCSCPC